MEWGMRKECMENEKGRNEEMGRKGTAE